MVQRIRAKITYVGFKSLKAKAMRALVKEKAQEVVQWWWKSILPRHFAADAWGKYHYTPRGKKYQQAKRRKYGHGKPLVYTGASMRSMKGAITVSGTSKGGRGKMTAPWYFTRVVRTKRGRVLDKAGEATAVTRGEATRMAWMLSELMGQAAAADKSVTVKRL